MISSQPMQQHANAAAASLGSTPGAAWGAESAHVRRCEKLPCCCSSSPGGTEVIQARRLRTPHRVRPPLTHPCVSLGVIEATAVLARGRCDQGSRAPRSGKPLAVSRPLPKAAQPCGVPADPARTPATPQTCHWSPRCRPRGTQRVACPEGSGGGGGARRRRFSNGLRRL